MLRCASSGRTHMLGNNQNPCLPGRLACAILLCCAVLALHWYAWASICLLPVLTLHLLEDTQQHVQLLICFHTIQWQAEWRSCADMRCFRAFTGSLLTYMRV